jgi:spore maturation protein CgeB
MKIVIFGLTLSSSWGNGHATLWRGLCGALIRQGHEIVFYERDVPYYAAHRDLFSLPGGELRLFDTWENIVSSARRNLAEADVAIVTSYCYDGPAASELVLNSGVGLRVFYDLDTPVTLDRWQTGRPVPYLGPRGLRDFDLVLSYTGGRALEELRTRLGARQVAPLYGSVDPEVHRPVPADPELAADLSYLGTYADDRQATLEMMLVEPARQLPRQRFLIGGAQYPQHFPWTENIFFVYHVEPSRHPAFFCSSRLTLNVTRRAMKAMGYCPSGRLFEAAACGAPILSDRWEGLDWFFSPGREIIVADTSDEAIAALQMDRDELQRIAQRARERVLSDHTAEQRARELVALLENARNGELAASAAITGGT